MSLVNIFKWLRRFQNKWKQTQAVRRKFSSGSLSTCRRYCFVAERKTEHQEFFQIELLIHVSLYLVRSMWKLCSYLCIIYIYSLSDVFRRAQLGTPKTQHLAQKSVNYMTVSFSSFNFRIFSSDHGSNGNRLVITGILFSLTLSLSKIYFLYLMFVIPLHENCL